VSKALSRFPLACVIWDDAHGKAVGEYSLDEISKEVHGPAHVKTFGLLIRSDEKGVTLCQDETADMGQVEYTHLRGVSFIPRAMVVDEVLLGIPKRPRVSKAASSTEHTHTPQTPIPEQ